MKLRVGIVGLGPVWEERHRPALRALSDRFEVRGVCDQVAHRAQQAAREFETVAIEGYQVLARRSDIDAILVLAPQWYGALPILAACESGKAVYCAAALDLSPPQARQVRERVERAGIAFTVEFPRRLAPATLRLKELIVTQLGQPRLLFCHRRSKRPLSNGNSCARQATTRELIELVDWCHYIVGRPPASVMGVRQRESEDRGEYRAISLEFAPFTSDGAPPLAQISCGHYLPESWREAITFRPPANLQVSCQHGVAFIDLPSSLVWFDEAGRHVESLESERPVGEQLFGQFHRAVTSLVRSTSDLDNAYVALNAVLAAEQSEQSGRRAALSLE